MVPVVSKAMETSRGYVDAGRLHGAAGAQDRRLGLQEVLGGLHDQGVGATGEQALGVGLEAVAEGAVVADVAEGGQLGAGADGAEDPALAAVAGGEVVGGLAGDAGAGLGEFVDALGDVVLGHRGVVRAEGVRLDAVHADAEVLLVDRADDVGAGDVQDLVAAFEVLEVVERGVLRLEHGAHGSVGDHHAGGECLSERGHPGPAVGRRGRWRRGHEGAPWSATAVGFAASQGTSHGTPRERARRQGNGAGREDARGVHEADLSDGDAYAGERDADRGDVRVNAV